MTPGEVRATREALGLSQSRLAELLSIDVMTVSRWERGERVPPPYLRLVLDHLACRPKR